MTLKSHQTTVDGDVASQGRRRRSRPAGTRRRRIVLTLLIAGTLLSLMILIRGAGGPSGSTATSADTATISETATQDPGDTELADALDAAGGGRPVFKYSVIPGGASDASELRRAADLDPVVGDHYRGIDLASLHPKTVTEPRMAYVSYRVGDQVYWTNHKVQIRSGETILTNGKTEIRGRCGNCISTSPMLPTLADEPGDTQFDALMDGEPLITPAETGRAVAAGPLADFGMGPFGEPFAANGGPLASLDQLLPFNSLPIGGSGSVLPFAAGGFPGGSVPPPTGQSRNAPASASGPRGGGAGGVGNIPGDTGGNPPGGGGSDGAGAGGGTGSGGGDGGRDIPPTNGLTPPGSFPSGLPGASLPGPFPPDSYQPVPSGGDDPGFPVAPNGITPRPQETAPVPVPEPGSLLLLGSGVALLARRLRSKRN